MGVSFLRSTFLMCCFVFTVTKCETFEQEFMNSVSNLEEKLHLVGETESSRGTENKDNSTVKLTVFYEALCPDSIAFFNEQLSTKYPALKSYVNLDLLPYGNAKQELVHGHWNFTCQHGPKECQYNTIQACAIKLLKNDFNSFKLISCLMKDKNESTNLHKCASAAKVDIAPVIKCAKSSKGSYLLAKLGQRTHTFKPQIKWVPSVAFNDVYSAKDQKASMKDLSKVICKHLKPKPKVCLHHQ